MARPCAGPRFRPKHVEHCSEERRGTASLATHALWPHIVEQSDDPTRLSFEGNLYPTTIHTLDAAIRKLAKVAMAWPDLARSPSHLPQHRLRSPPILVSSSSTGDDGLESVPRSGQPQGARPRAARTGFVSTSAPPHASAGATGTAVHPAAHGLRGCSV